MATWSNWSGSLRFTPRALVEPRDEDELCQIVCQAASNGETVRVVGAGHSSTPLVETSDLLVSLAKLQAVEIDGLSAGEAAVGAGVTLGDAGIALRRHDLAFANLGDVDYQTVAGAVGTGTHGTGKRLPTLASHLIGGRLVTGSGERETFTLECQPERVNAMRVSLGVLGILTTLRLRLIPAYRVRRSTWCAGIDDCLDQFMPLSEAHRHVDFYWYPRSDEAQIRITDREDALPAEVDGARLLSEEIGWSNDVIPRTRDLRFDEIEYGLPAEHGLACFREVRQRVKDRWRRVVGWRVLVRTVAADSAYLSMAYDRPTVTISLHQNASLPYQEYFADVETLFCAYGGRPHWGKKHTLSAAALRPLYPRWDDFLAERQRVDPHGLFLNSYLRQLLGVDVP